MEVFGREAQGHDISLAVAGQGLGRTKMGRQKPVQESDSHSRQQRGVDVEDGGGLGRCSGVAEQLGYMCKMVIQTGRGKLGRFAAKLGPVGYVDLAVRVMLAETKGTLSAL